jgi:uncharacterized protein YjbI with pentapeptide repeats
MTKRKKISQNELKTILENHEKWLKNSSDGTKANLSGFNLQNIELCGTNLKGATLQNVDLSFSDLVDVNLSDADLSNSDIVNAEWRGVLLSNSDLSNVDLRETSLLQGPYTQGANEDLSMICNCSGVNFSKANLSKADLTKGIFSKANFTDAILTRSNFSNATIIGAKFINSKMENTDFSNALLIDSNVSGASLTNTNFNNSNITGIEYSSSLKKSEYIKFRGLRVENSYGSPVFKRFSQDQDYLYEYKQKNPFIFKLWYYSSMCGKSMGLWMFWSLLIALLFGVLYSNFIAADLNMETKGFFTPFYFSIVTFTTLGFGDIAPNSLVGQLWVTLEVVIGYVMLGGLISIFSNKLAQRS